MATKREEYIAKLKTRRSMERRDGEVESQAAQAQANMRAEYEKQLARSVSVRTRQGTLAQGAGRPRATPGWSSLAARTRPGRRCARPSRRPARNSRSSSRPRNALRRPASPSQDRVEALDVVDDAPLRRASRHDPLLPGLEPPHVAPRVDIVGLPLDDVERHHADVLEVDWKLADGHLVELFLHVGEDQDGLRPSARLVQETLRPWMRPPVDVRIGAAPDALHECVNLVLEGALLDVRPEG